MKFLLTNDDGIAAPGMTALFEAVRFCFGKDAEVVVVAPDRARSECGHSITSGRPLRLNEVRPGWFSVDGTPVDCVRTAISLPIAADADFVLSGVNAGANLGIDLLVSGTFAAAREAALQGCPAMACSHYRRPDVPKTWDHVGRWLGPVLLEFVETTTERAKRRPQATGSGEQTETDHGHPPSPGLLWNVNLPALDPDTPSPRTVVCPVDRCPMYRTARRLADGAAADEAAADEAAEELFKEQLQTGSADRQAALLENSTDEDPKSDQPPGGNLSSRSDRIELKSDFHGRPRKPGTDVDLCFGGQLTISKVEPHLF